MMSASGEVQENFVTRRIMAPNFKLNNGLTIPILGLGTWKSRNMDCFTAVSQAIDIGYRHIDTAFVYQNEVEVGKAINQKIKDEEVKREDLFICTKLANIHHDPTVVEYACRQSLNNLKLKYIDLYLIHFPVGESYQEIEDISGKLDLTDTDYVKTWAAMEALVEKGLVKSIGVSNFNSEQITRILQNCTIRPVVNQVECHPGFNQKELIKFCKRNSIHVVAYCPLGRPDPERKWPNYMYDHTIRKLAQKYEKTPAQLCLRYVIQLGAWPIPKSVKHERIIENFQVFDFIISPEDMEIMDGYNRNRRLIPFTPMKNHIYYPFNIPY